MQFPRRRILLLIAGAILLVALTANLWIEILANAVIDQVLLPLTRLIVRIFV